MQPILHSSFSNQQPASQAMFSGGGSSKVMMEQLKSTLLTLFMVNSMGKAQNGGNATTSTDMLMMVYVFVITQLIEIFMQYLPQMVDVAQRRFFNKISHATKHHAISSTSMFSENGKSTAYEQIKTASIILNIAVNGTQNVVGQALLEYITNHKNTKHIRYVGRNYILNEQGIIDVGDDVLIKMSERTISQREIGSEINNTSETTQSLQTTKNLEEHIQKYEVFSYVKTTKELRDFLVRLERDYKIALNNQFGFKRFYFDLIGVPAPIIPGPKKDTQIKDYSRLPSQFMFNMKEFHTNRKFSNLFGNDVEKIRERVNFFVNNKKWYEEKGVPYTLGLLISGPPGTGKTSIIKCLAKETGRNVVNINFNNDISKAQLEHLFFSDVINVNNPFTKKTETYNVPLDERIIVLEDADCQADILRKRVSAPPTATPILEPSAQDLNTVLSSTILNEPMAFGGGGGGYSMLEPSVVLNESTENTQKVDLSFLLNLLDGVLEMPGRIIIMTSNHPEILDDALIRPGRIDIIAKFQNCTHATMMQMFEFFYSTTLTTEQCNIIKSTPEFTISPARVSQLMFERFDDVEGALKLVQKWCEQ